MASTTIHTLSYKMIADTKNFSKGVLATKSEVQLLKKIMGDTTPEQKAADAMKRIDSLYAKGKITAKQQAEAIKAVNLELGAQLRQANKVTQAFDKMQGVLKKGAKIGAGAAVAGATFLGFSAVKEIEKMKGLADAAEDLGMNYNDLVKVQQAFIRGGEVSGDVVVPALRLMNENIQLASRDMGRFKKLAGELGLEMDTMQALSKMPVLEQFRVVVDQISKLPDQGAKGLIVKKLFGTDESKLTTLLGGGLENLEKIAATADQFGMTLKSGNIESVKELVSQTERLQDTWTGLIRQLAVELTPWLDKTVKVIEAINGFLGGPKMMETPAAVAGPGGRVGAIDPSLMFLGRTPAEYAMLRNFSNQAKLIDPNFSAQSAGRLSPVGTGPSASLARGLQQLQSESFRTGNVAKDEQIMQSLLSQLTNALKKNAEAQERANEQRRSDESRIN